MSNQFVPPANPVVPRGEHLYSERFAVGSIHQQLHQCLIAIEVGKEACREGIPEFLLRYLGASIPDTKRNQRFNIAG